MHHLQQWEDQKSTPKCGLFIPGLSFTSLKVAKTKLEAEQNQVFRHDCPFFPASCWTVKTRAQPFPWLQIIYVRVYQRQANPNKQGDRINEAKTVLSLILYSTQEQLPLFWQEVGCVCVCLSTLVCVYLVVVSLVVGIQMRLLIPHGFTVQDKYN